MFNSTSPGVAKAIASLHETRPFVVRPIIDRVGLSGGAQPQLGTHRTAAASYLYIRREAGSDSIGPLPPAYLEKRHDLVDMGRAYPRNTPPALREGRLLWDEADSAALRHDIGDASATHIVASLPSAMTSPEWRELVTKWALEALVSEGMIADWCIHALADPDTGKWTVKPHVHVLATARDFKPGLRRGRRQFAWLKSSRQVQACEDIWLRLTGLQPLPATA
jgi:MobA/MobL family